MHLRCGYFSCIAKKVDMLFVKLSASSVFLVVFISLCSKNGFLINVGTLTDKIDSGRNAVALYFPARQDFTEASDAEPLDTERAAQHVLLHVGGPLIIPSRVVTMRVQMIPAKSSITNH